MEENKKIKIFNKKNICIICVFLALILGAVLFLKLYNSNISKFKRSLSEYNIDELTEIYKSSTNYDERKEIEKIFEDYLYKILNQFAVNEKTYEEASYDIDKFSDLKNLEKIVSKAKNDLKNIKNSKDNFANGQSAESNNSLFDAIEFYSKVIELDSNNYKYAQTYINNNKNTLKSQTLEEVDKLIASNDLVSATHKLELLKTIFNNDSEINNKILDISAESKKQEIEQYKNNQEVVVLSSKKYQEWYSSSLSGIQVIVKNNTQKVVKSYTISILAYDSNGFPLKIDYSGYEKLCSCEGANIQPGDTHGKDNYCSIYYEKDKIASSIACIKEVEYYDGTRWENPYYEHWIEQYKEKPLS